MKYLSLSFSILIFCSVSFGRGIFFPKTDTATESNSNSSAVTATAVSETSTTALAYQPELPEAKMSGDPTKLAKGVFALYQDPRAGRAVCMASASSDPQSVLRRNGIGYMGNPSGSEVAALAKGISQVERLLGKPLPSSWRTNYNFINATGKWNQGANAINVRRPRGSDKGTNIGRMMHELGHRAGNAGAYGRYRTAMNGKRCSITPYATKRANEEFAEVFEAYVAFPDLLRSKCPDAYNFFSTKLFPGSERKNASCRGTAQNAINEMLATGKKQQAETGKKIINKERSGGR